MFMSNLLGARRKIKNASVKSFIEDVSPTTKKINLFVEKTKMIQFCAESQPQNDNIQTSTVG